MKKISKDQYEYIKRVTVKRTRRHFFRLNCERSRKRDVSDFSVIKAPEIFTATVNVVARAELLSFISKIKLFCAHKSRVLIDFSATKKMHTCGTIIFTAELRNIINLYGNNIYIRCIKSNNSKVMEVLKQLELLDILKYRKRIIPHYHDVVQWRCTHGRNVDGKEYEKILSHLDDKLGSNMQRGFYVGLTEAMSNTHQHAYIDNRPEGEVCNSVESWWAFSQIKDSRLHVVFFDLGIGIPKSLPIKRPGWFKRILLGNPTPNDTDIIINTIRFSQTRTGEEHRGKGLRQLVGVIENIEGAKLSILSNRGGYRLDNGLESSFEYNDSIGGTLIEWSLPIRPEEGIASE